ncbi:MAG: aspartate 1-decarboxylase [Candidatus Micrarchaeia archaeon]
MRWVLRSKIHNATVTESNLNYIGSITIDKALIEKAGFIPGEKVTVASTTTGARLETYIIEGKKNSGVIAMNGPAAHIIKAGEHVVIMAFELASKKIKPKVILVDEHNRFLRQL